MKVGGEAETNRESKSTIRLNGERRKSIMFPQVEFQTRGKFPLVHETKKQLIFLQSPGARRKLRAQTQPSPLTKMVTDLYYFKVYPSNTR